MQRYPHSTWHLARPSRSAFTLIEVLVVTAIIALLIAILLPSLARVRFQTKVTVCRTNLHQLGAAFMMYSESYRGYYPVTGGAGEDSYFALGSKLPTPGARWKSSYLPDVKLLLCPATRNKIRTESLGWNVVAKRYEPCSSGCATEFIPMMSVNTSNNPDDADKSDIDRTARNGREDDQGGHSYEYNGCYDSGSGALAKHHKKTSHFNHSATMLLVHDNDESINNNYAGCETSDDKSGNNCPQPWDNHGAEGMNMMFGDGHSEWVKKLGGMYVDYTSGSATPRMNVNASIDKIWLRSQFPWLYGR